jgi:hypothetical protein
VLFVHPLFYCGGIVIGNRFGNRNKIEFLGDRNNVTAGKMGFDILPL